MPQTCPKWIVYISVAIAASTLGIAAGGTALAETRPAVYVTAWDRIIGLAGAPGKVLPVWAYRSMPTTGATVTMDLSAVTKIATVKVLNDLCTLEQDKQLVTCLLAFDTAESASGYDLPLLVTALPTATDGSSAKIRIVATDHAGQTTSEEPKVTIADGVDLAVTAPSRPLGSARPKDTIYADMAYANVGNRTASDTSFEITLDSDLIPARYEGCTYTPVGRQTHVSCPAGEPLATNEVVTFYTVDGNKKIEGFAVTVDADALGGKMVAFHAGSAGVADDIPPALAARSTKVTSGRQYKIVRTSKAQALASPEIDDSNNWGWRIWSITNRMDLAALGSSAHGAVGDDVRVSIGMKNVGPSAVDFTDVFGVGSLKVYFTLPAGTRLLDLVAGKPEECTVLSWIGSEPHQFSCSPRDEYLAVGASSTFEFVLKITSVTPDAAGPVTLRDTFLDTKIDDNPANDTATVVINPTSEPSPSAGASSTNPVGVELPVTGGQPGTIAAGGAALLVAGTGLLLLARQRRGRVVVPGDRTVD